MPWAKPRLAKGSTVRALLAAVGAELPDRAVDHGPGLRLQRGERQVGAERHVGGDDGETKTRADPRGLQAAVLPDRKPGCQRAEAGVDVGCRGGMDAGVETQLADVFGQHGGVFRAAQAGALGLRVHDPRGPGLVPAGVAGVGGEDHQRMCVIGQRGGGGGCRLAQVGHDHVDPCGQRLGLAFAQVAHKGGGTGVAAGAGQTGRVGQGADAHHRGVVVIAERLEVVGPFGGVVRDDGPDRVDPAAAQHIHHCLKGCHRVDDALRCIGPDKGERGKGDRGEPRQGRVQPAQPFQRKAPQMDRA